MGYRTCHFSSLGVQGFLAEVAMGTTEIFKCPSKEGHFCEDTPENRQRLIDLASDVTKFCGEDKWGNCWNAANDNKGKQLWVRYRGHRIEDGGINPKPRIWDPDTGLSNNPFSRK